MPTPIRRITSAQFALLALPSQLTRKIAAVHVHHTFRPRRQDFRGLATVEAMRKFHMEQNGWSDIAQHLTIDPQGGLWTGRNWNMAPASATGHNGTAAEGPFMIEMVGDFDAGQDPFDGDQRTAALETVAHLLRAFKLQDKDIKFHNQMTNLKSCPGTGIDRAAFVSAVLAIPARPEPPDDKAKPFRAEHLLGADSVRAGVAADKAAAFSMPENQAAWDAIEANAREAVSRAQRRARATGPRVFSADTLNVSRDPSDWTVLKPHVINLAKGELSESGEFTTTPDQVVAIVDAIRDYAAGTEHPRLMIHAHGGLVKETSALGYAKSMYQWWLDHGVYPVFFVWETDILEILGQFVLGRRDVFDFTSDPVIEGIVKVPGSAAWAGMKESARLASSIDTGEGVIGGARLFARKLAALLKEQAETAIPVHAVGHSAGAIFHAHFVPALLAEGVAAIEHLYVLAPAARTELFHEQLAKPVGDGTVKALSMFTMEEEAEESDDCFKVYRKSLLYLVSHATEGLKRRPILGLHKSIRKDAALRALFGVREDGSLTGGGAAKLHLSLARGKPENPLTRSLQHGEFDNDAKTMSSVLRRVVGVADETGLGEADFPFPPLPRTFDFSVLKPAPGAALAASPGPPATPSPGAGGAKRLKALCIGINAYPERPLSGCVSDTRAWGKALTDLGARVEYLLDEQATYEGMKTAIRSLVSGAAAGDAIVLQYSGHGAQLPNRVDTEEDGYNEALVPVDYDTGALLVDDELAQILRGLPAGASMTLFMDCCHSGTNSRFAPPMRARAAAGDRPRFMPLGDDVVEAYFSRRGARALARAADISLPGIVHFAACQDHEYAWESDGQGDYTGAATTVLVQAVKGGVLNEAFASDVAKAVAAKNRQHPQLMQLDPAMQGRVLFGGVGVS
jgi:hypothetical protein